MTQVRKRTRIIVRMSALIDKWWSLSVRLLDPETRRDSRTSRPQMMDGVRVIRHSRQVKLMLTMTHSAPAGLRARLVARARFLRELQNAPQSKAVENWHWNQVLQAASQRSQSGCERYPSAGFGLTKAPIDHSRAAGSREHGRNRAPAQLSLSPSRFLLGQGGNSIPS